MRPAQETVYLCSLPADSALLQRSWLNRLAEFWAPRPKVPRRAFVHTELFFPSSVAQSGSMMSGVSARIVYGGKVQIGAKMFNRSSWHFDALSVSPTKRAEMLQWLHRREGEPFDKLGFFGLWKSNRKHYCSRLAGRCLRETGVMPLLTNRDINHPERLAQAVQAAAVRFAGTPRNLCSLNLMHAQLV